MCAVALIAAKRRFFIETETDRYVSKHIEFVNGFRSLNCSICATVSLITTENLKTIQLPET